MLKKGTAKVQLGFYFVRRAKIRYDWDFTVFKMLNEVRLGSYIVEKAKTKYG